MFSRRPSALWRLAQWLWLRYFRAVGFLARTVNLRVEISPLDNALLDIEQRTKELLALEVKFTALAKTAPTINAEVVTRDSTK